MNNLSELLLIHPEFEEIFFQHQCRLLHFDFDGALEILAEYTKALKKHAEDEETYLMPIYEERAAKIKGGGAKLFLDEHFKLNQFVEMLYTEIETLKTDPQPEKKLLWILDREAFFKRLSDHHDIRETDIFYPEMDRITSQEEKDEILSKVTRSFAAKA